MYEYDQQSEQSESFWLFESVLSTTNEMDNQRLTQRSRKSTTYIFKTAQQGGSEDTPHQTPCHLTLNG